jgi:hypothetical protein
MDLFVIQQKQKGLACSFSKNLMYFSNIIFISFYRSCPKGTNKIISGIGQFKQVKCEKNANGNASNQEDDQTNFYIQILINIFFNNKTSR